MGHSVCGLSSVSNIIWLQTCANMWWWCYASDDEDDGDASSSSADEMCLLDTFTLYHSWQKWGVVLDMRVVI